MQAANGLAVYSKAVNYYGFNPQTIMIELFTKVLNEKHIAESDFQFTCDGINYAVPKKRVLTKDVQKHATF